MTGRRPRAKRPIPFEFVIEALDGLHPHTRQMFGCTAVYVGNKIVFARREKDNYTSDNGVWVATTPDHHESLRKILPSLRSIKMFGTGSTGWQVIPAEAQDFEDSAQKACDLVLIGDPRIGKIPQVKMRKAPRKKPKGRKN